ncbi:MAG: hypothetical protein M1817_003852 [Caeruleum heppii]|nr:MAG: hypothetical protein M1817_003852 [Caeruleum heppii]
MSSSPVTNAKFRSWSLTPRKIVMLAGFFTTWLLFYHLISALNQDGPALPGTDNVDLQHQRTSYSTSMELFNATSLPNAAFQPPEPFPHRIPDMVDTFADYRYRSTCNISSLDLHTPFASLCTDRVSLLNAMSSGGRIGHDAPYMPRGCDMRWFSTNEICEILSRFEKVIFVGDSMMRHVIGSINVLIRKDLGRDCFCNFQFNVKACSIQGIYKTADVVKNDPESVACPAGSIDVMIEQMIKFPIPPEETDRFKELLGTTKPQKPYAFVFGHGLWNDLDLQATLNWLDELLALTTAQLPYLDAPKAFWPRLILTPNAAGREKPDEWLVSQGNKALMVFEEAVAIEAGRRGVEALGTWNMSIQSTKFDGVHLDLKGNLIKAMMVLNWLNMLEVEKH